MQPEREVDYILDECFFAVGQAVGKRKQLDYDAIVWWRSRYRQAFLRALIVSGNSWVEDRDRVMAVGRCLGTRAVHHTGDKRSIDVDAAQKASAEIEAGCHMSRLRQGA